MPLFIESAPREGPIVFSCNIEIGIGSEPDFRIIDKSFACSKEKLPEILPLPNIWSRTTGEDLTLPSRIIAILFPIFSLVSREKIFVPSELRARQHKVY